MVFSGYISDSCMLCSGYVSRIAASNTHKLIKDSCMVCSGYIQKVAVWWVHTKDNCMACSGHIQKILYLHIKDFVWCARVIYQG